MQALLKMDPLENTQAPICFQNTLRTRSPEQHAGAMQRGRTVRIRTALLPHKG